MKHLWAPWRMPFIKKALKSTGCIFCSAARSKADARHFVLARGKTCFALLNIFPYNNGHLMVSPYEHTGSFSAIGPDTWREIMAMAGDCQKVLERTHKPHGFNMGINIGRAGGAGIEDHLHVHVVPRWNGDCNFMPVLSSTKVVPQSLEESYSVLAAAMKKPGRIK